MIYVLPKYLLLSVWKEWLSLKEIGNLVGNLDSSFCFDEIRKCYESYLSQGQFIFSKDKFISSEVNVLCWIVAREFNVSSLFLELKTPPNFAKDEEDSFQTLVKDHRFKGLRHLKVICGEGCRTYEPLICRSPDLQRLDFVNENGNTSITNIMPVLSIAQNKLTTLSLYRFTLDYMSINTLKSHCMSLSELRLVKCGANCRYSACNHTKHCEIVVQHSKLAKI